jgi:hypothetical protein
VLVGACNDHFGFFFRFHAVAADGDDSVYILFLGKGDHFGGNFVLPLNGLGLAVSREQDEVIFLRGVFDVVEGSTQKPYAALAVNKNEIREMWTVEVGEFFGFKLFNQVA